MKVRGIRGATTVAFDEEDEILNATDELLQRIIAENATSLEDIATIVFTMSPDLHRAFPARAARRLGMNDVPLLCASELDVDGGLPRCIRVLLFVNTEKTQQEIRHVYLRDAENLRATT
jgi:chorismate mutase